MSEITGVPANDIRTLAREYATTQPAAIRQGVAIERSRGGGQATVRALAGGGTWKHLVLPPIGPLAAAEWRALVAATLERALDRWSFCQHHAAQAARDRSGAKQALARARVAWANYWELREEAERLLGTPT